MAVQEEQLEQAREESTDEIAELISQPAKVVQYGARRIDLRLVKQPIYPIYGPGGRTVGEQPGQTIKFSNGIFTIDLSQPETTVEAGRTVPTDELVEWMEKHRLLGYRDEGFFKIEVSAPPIGEAENQALVDAAVELDEDRLRELIATEEAGWQRDALLGPARRALASVEKLKAEAAAEAKK